MNTALGDKYIITAGLAEDTEAHLRLLLRRATPMQLHHVWQWGTESNADLVVVNPQTIAGRLAREAASSGGRRCIVIDERQDLRSNELRLDTPFNPGVFYSLLNDAAEIGTHTGQLSSNRMDDFAGIADQFKGMSNADEPSKPAGEVAESLEDVLKRDKEEELVRYRLLEVKETNTTEAADRVSSRSHTRTAFGRSDVKARPPALPPAVTTPQTPRDDRWIGAYLGGELLRTPAAIGLPGMPELIIDPAQRVFHSAAGALQELTAYCERPISLSAWRLLDDSELEQARVRYPARPYTHLNWLFAWLHSRGRLAKHLPSAAQFRLRAMSDVASAAGHKPIAEAMLSAGTVQQIAARADSRQEVIVDLINAYDAIGFIEINPRDGESTAASRLFSRLRDGFRQR